MMWVVHRRLRPRKEEKFITSITKTLIYKKLEQSQNESYTSRAKIKAIHQELNKSYTSRVYFERNSSKRRTCNAVALRTLDMPKETYTYVHSGCRFSTFRPATAKSASLSDVGKLAASSGACLSGPHTEAMHSSVVQNQPYLEYANQSGRESLTTNHCVMEITYGQK